MKMISYANVVVSGGGSGAVPLRHFNAVKAPSQSLKELAAAGGNATSSCGNTRRRTGIKFREQARMLGKNVGCTHPRASKDTLAGECRARYASWLTTNGIQDKHRAFNIELAIQCALDAQRESSDVLGPSESSVFLDSTDSAAGARQPTSYRGWNSGCSQPKARYSLADEINLPQMRHISPKQMNSNKWERRKVVIWDHTHALKPADLISQAESAGVDLSGWLKVRKVNGSERSARANRLEVFCLSEAVREDVLQAVVNLLEGTIEAECVRLGRTHGLREKVRSQLTTSSASLLKEGFTTTGCGNIYEVLSQVDPEGQLERASSRANTPSMASAPSRSGLKPKLARGTANARSRAKKDSLVVWTLNCQGVTSKVVELSELVKIHKPDVLVLTETWLKGDAVLNLPGYKGQFVNRKSQCARGEGGVAIFTTTALVTRECAPSAYADLLWTKVHLLGRKPLLVGGFYGPQESVTDEVASKCYTTLSNELSTHAEARVVLLGDFNAKIGNVHSHVGKFGPAVGPSRNGKLLLNVLTTHNLRVLNGQSAEGIHTTRHSEGSSPAMLDLVVADMGIACHEGARVLRDAEIGSDHLIVEATLDIATKGPQRNNGNIHKRWNRERLLRMVEEARAAKTGDDPPPPTEFEIACNRKLEGWIEKARHSRKQVDEGDSVDIESLWGEWLALVNEAGREAVGQKTISRRSRSFIGVEERTLIQERRELFAAALQSSNSSAWAEYVEKRKEVARAISASKQLSWTKFNKEIIQTRKKNPKRFWNLIKRLDKNHRKNTVIELNRPDGTPCSSNEQILEEFTEHFATVGLNTPGAVFDREWQKEVENYNKSTLPSDDSDVLNEYQAKLLAPMSVDEIAAAVKDVKNGKATGRDGVPSEFLKHGGSAMWESLALLFDMCRAAESTPRDWHLVNIVPIYKKGDKYARANYRRVSLLSCVYKLYARVLQRRLAPFLEEQIVAEQAGFSAGKGCDDNLCTMTAVMEHMIAERKPLYVALVDMRAAFDTVWRDGLWYKLETMGVPHKLVRIFQEIYSHGRFRVVANGQEGNDVEAVTAGVLQGDVLSPDLFKAFINDLPQFMATAGCSGVKISDTERLMLLLFADDILLWGNTQEELQLQLDTLGQYCQLWQLEVNAAKTKVLLSPHAKLDTPLLYDRVELEV